VGRVRSRIGGTLPILGVQKDEVVVDRGQDEGGMDIRLQEAWGGMKDHGEGGQEVTRTTRLFLSDT
jgi:hypothetical protein